MDQAQTPPLPLAFLAASLTAVLVVVLLLVPHRSGRTPLALFDQFSGFGIVGALGAYAVSGAQGAALWVPGCAGLIAGLSAYLLANLLWLRGKDSQALRSSINVLAFAACTSLTALVAFGARSLLNT